MKDVETPNYFHNLANRYFAPGDEIRINIKHEDKSWSKRMYQVISMTPETTVIEPMGAWISYNAPKKTKPTTVKKAA